MIQAEQEKRDLLFYIFASGLTGDENDNGFKEDDSENNDEVFIDEDTGEKFLLN